MSRSSSSHRQKTSFVVDRSGASDNACQPVKTSLLEGDVVSLPRCIDYSPAEKKLTIGEVVSRSGMTARAIRYYEELDLISPVCRSEGGYRLYGEQTLKRLSAISALQELGFTLESIRQTLGSACEAMTSQDKTQRIQRSRNVLESQLFAVNQRIKALALLQQDLESRLKGIVDHCEPCVEHRVAQECDPHCTYRGIHID
ncbi:MAG: MerR family transcriptional regulator [Vampirovibrionales bacterium]